MAHRFDVLIIGSGLAGLTLALHLAAKRKVGVVTKKELLDGASNWAQGGIAAVLAGDDTTESHVHDTLVAGAGLCDETITRFVVERGRECVDWLIGEGVPFTRDAASDTGYHLTTEGGHSHRRVIHVDDATGHAVQVTLESKVRSHPNITLLENHNAVDLITAAKLGLAENRCLGAYVLDTANGKVVTIAARHVVLATGGAGKVDLYTTNPDTSTGDGIAMGWRAGCRVGNMEFIQFHPTCLYHAHAKPFLISEAVRGEGGLLKLPDGTRFMPAHDPRAELAPRDIVARAIDFEMKKRGLDCVHLDITHKPADWIRTRFPRIFERCADAGIDITTRTIPVVPAAHYSCGGVAVDAWGRSSLRRLYAVGEVSCTGLHGANRLASASLLECLVWGTRAGDHAAGAIASGTDDERPDIAAWQHETELVDPALIAQDWLTIRQTMWNYVGLVRTRRRLDRAHQILRELHLEIGRFYAQSELSDALIGLRNGIQTALVVLLAAMEARTSAGCHYLVD